MRALGIAAVARWVASMMSATLSDPVSSSVGAVMLSNWPGRYGQSCSARHSRGTVGAAARRTGRALAGFGVGRPLDRSEFRDECPRSSVGTDLVG